MASSKRTLEIRLERLRKTMIILSHEGQQPGPNPNRVPPIYKSKAFTLHQPALFQTRCYFASDGII